MVNQGINRRMSPERRAAKHRRHVANVALRAGLHKQKTMITNVDGRLAVQKRIDAIGAGSQSNS